MLRPLPPILIDKSLGNLALAAAVGAAGILLGTSLEAKPGSAWELSRVATGTGRAVVLGWRDRTMELTDALEPVTSTTWLGVEFQRPGRLKLPAKAEYPLLDRYSNPGRYNIRTGQESFWSGRYGVRSWDPWSSLSLDATACVAPGAPLESPVGGASLAGWRFVQPDWGVVLLRGPQPSSISRGALEILPTWLLDSSTPPEPEVLAFEADPPCPAGRRTRPVTIGRYGMEQDTFRLTECDGSIAAEALDRLSVLARPPGTARPALPLPPEPDRSAPHGEWVENVKLVHPRLVWAVQQIAYAFPGRALYIVSGYRPESGTSNHANGRALDLFVSGASNERLLRVCRSLRDIGCGYYPNNHFVHVDVRPPGSGHPLWVDTSEPGQRSNYVSGWPGVVEGGALNAGGEL